MTELAGSKYFGAELVPADRLALIDEIRRIMRVPEIGVAFVLDEKGRLDYPDWKRGKACYFCVEDDEPDPYVPECLWEIYKTEQYHHIVWISKDVWADGTDEFFCWIIAHELQHLMQYLRNPMIPRTDNFLHDTLGSDRVEERFVNSDLPAEVDADIKAWTVLAELNGKKAADSYVAMKANSREADSKRYQDLQERTFNNGYNVESELPVLLRRYRDQLELVKQDRAKKIAEESKDFAWPVDTSRDSVVTFDIDSALAKLEP